MKPTRTRRAPRPPTPLDRAIAASLGAPPALLPVLPDAVAGLDSLGSTPRTVAALLARHGARPSWRVLDLACGKGAAAVAIARRLGCRVTGLDAFAPFIESARALSARRAVAARCEFIIGDVRRWRSPRRFDAALMLGLFGVDRAPDLLRPRLRAGGLYIVDDAFLDGPRGRATSAVPTLDEARAALTRRGDTIVEESIPARESVTRAHARLLRRLLANAARLSTVHPEFAPALREFVARHREARRALTGPLRGAVWLVRLKR